MTLYRLFFYSLFVLFLSLQAGCSVNPVQMVVVSDDNFTNRKDVNLENWDQQPCSIKNIGTSGPNSLQADSNKNNPDNFRIKYHFSYATNHWVVVEGQLSSGSIYPVILDTGASIGLFVNDIHIRENGLSIQPAEAGAPGSVSWGRCYLPKLRIGKIELTNWPCFYKAQHTEVQLFGVPVTMDKSIIMGLGALREFKYVIFDNIAKEAELSLDKIFEPENANLWTQHPFVIEEDFVGNAFLFVEISIAGQPTSLQIDTGSGRGLAIAENLWKNIRDKIPNVRMENSKELYPYIGWLPCKSGIVSAIEIGGRTVRNARISVFPDDSPLVEDCQGLVGMEYFHNTVMVLDFERNRMWIKNPARAF